MAIRQSNSKNNVFPRWLFFLLGWVVFQLSGCMVGPEFAQPSSPAIQHQYSAGKWATADPMSSSDWWNFFSDDVLNGLIQRAQSQNLPLREAFERIVEARSNVQLKGGQLKPNGDVFGEYQYSKNSANARPFVAANSDPFDLFRLGLDTSWELDLFGKIKRGIEAANSELQFQEYEYEYIRQTLLSDIAVSYLQIRLLQNQIILVQENLEIQQKTLQLVRERSEAGVSTELDEKQTEAFRFRTKSLLSSLQRDVELEFNQIALLLGQVPSEALKLEVGVRPLPAMPAVPQYGVPASLLSLRPDVKREEMAVMAATANIGIAEADLYPQLSLLGSISVSAKSVSALFETNGLAFSVGPSFTWNILHFNRINNNISIQESKLRQALIRYQNTVLNAVKEVEDSLISQEGFRRQWTDLQSATSADQKAVELSLERYRAGKANFQRVLDAQQQLLNDKRQLAQAQIESISETVRLFKAAGGWSFAQSSGCPTGSCSQQSCGCNQSQPQVVQPAQQTMNFVPNQIVPHQPGQAYFGTPLQNLQQNIQIDQTAGSQFSTRSGVGATQVSTTNTFKSLPIMTKNEHYPLGNSVIQQFGSETTQPIRTIPNEQAAPLESSDDDWHYGTPPKIDSPAPPTSSIEEDEPFSIDFESLEGSQ